MTYDQWKADNPADRWLGPEDEPEEEPTIAEWGELYEPSS